MQEQDELPVLLNQAHRHAVEHIEGLEARSVFPTAAALEGLTGFDEPLPAEPSPAAEVLETLHRIGSPATVAQTVGRYFGFVDGGALPVGVAARWLADVWDQNTAQYVMSPVASHLEEVCEAWIVDLLGLPGGTAAGFVCGTTLANFSGLCAGRNELLRRRGWDVAKKGLHGAPRLRVLAGDDAHASVFKVVSLLGMGTECVELIETDEQGRMIPDRIPDLAESALVITQAGNVNSGAFDPVGAVCDRVQSVGSWVHVDGAFGLWAGASPALRSLYEGCERADSWSVDAHKTLNVPYDSGIVLCRDRAALTSAFEASGAYFQWTDRREGMQYTPTMSRRARGVELWAVLKSLGRSGVAALIDRLVEHAGLFATLLRETGFEIRNDVVFNQVLISCEDDELTARTLERVQASGECWCGGSVWNGSNVIRISVCDWATSAEDVERAVAAFVRARDEACRGPNG
ncbi:MAG: aspartate aminotransferase family protein [Planctomycetes bacterium]|nr:aspartate aminotransferase family protein [Planctomycetota bacterium]